MDWPDFLIYTDGACSGNPGPGGWGAIVLGREGRVRELGGGCPRTTNNRMELSAAIAALRHIAGHPGRAELYTDSTYAISGITRWLPVWRRRGWTRADGEDILNRDLWEELDALAQGRREGLSWNYVRGHRGHPGNSRCDELAAAWARGRRPALYDGPLTSYGVALDRPEPEPLPVPAAKGRSSGKKTGGWYLSLLDGRLEKHLTWAECQARVHGKPALFKKVTCAEEEAAALKKWGRA